MSEVLYCRLSDVRLSSLLQFISLESHTGYLHVGEAGCLGFVQGQIVEAHYGYFGGLPAFRQLFLERRGDCVLESAPVATGEPFGTMTRLIMDALLLLDEWGRMAPEVLSPTERIDWLGPDAAVLSLMDGRRTTARAIQVSGYAVMEVLPELLRLKRQGTLRAVDKMQLCLANSSW
jgi:hypothetical protein